MRAVNLLVVFLSFVVILFGIGLLITTPPYLYNTVFGILLYNLGLLVLAILLLKQLICDEEVRREVCGGGEDEEAGRKVD